MAVSERAEGHARFLGVEARSTPLPMCETLLAVWLRLRLDSPASPCGPFIVELFAAALLASRGRRGRHSPVPCPRGQENSLRRQRLNEPDGPSTRFGCDKRSFGPNPRGGFQLPRSHAVAVTHFEQHGLSDPCVSLLACSATREPREVLPCRPAFRAGLNRIERPDYSSRWTRGGLLGRASTNPDEPLSRHPASLGPTRSGWLDRHP